MTFGWIALALFYLLILFYVAAWGDKNSSLARKVTSHPAVYSLGLAIYCTAWTFMGSVGQAAREQWAFLPILLGPILVYIVGYRFIYKLTLVSKKLHITTIADFIASRYGKRQPVALIVTLLALLATIPYIALQIKAVGATFTEITQSTHSGMITLLATVALAIFAMYFGTRQSDVTENRRGLILAIAFESCVKLIALVVMAFVAYYLWNEQSSEPRMTAFFTPQALESMYGFNFITQTVMAAAAVICLPRQFHITVVDNLKLEHLKTARWLFPLYLAVIAFTIPVIASAGEMIFTNQGLEPDRYVLAMAIHADSLLLKIVVFVGGLSAATAMIIVATLTLSTMISNDVVLPRFLSSTNRVTGQDVSKHIRLIRRIVIAVVLFLAFIYHQQLANASSLHSIGLIAFSLVIQLLPAIIGGLYWRRGHAHGVYAGLIAGILVWFSWLVLPVITKANVDADSNTVLSQAAMLSLCVNSLAYWLFSVIAKPRLIDSLQAIAFVSPAETRPAATRKALGVDVTAGDLVTLLATFLGTGRCEQLVEQFEHSQDEKVDRDADPTDAFLNFCERALGGVIGSSSSKTLVDSVIRGKKLDFTDVIHFFDDTAQTMQQNMTALLTSLEIIDQGMCVIDKNLDLVAWNKQYARLYKIPENLLDVGTPIEKIIRHNAANGEFGPGDPEKHVEKRMNHLRAGNYHKFTRERADGRVIEMVGNPLPGGGFVTSFTDITNYMEIQKALQEAKIDLEDRVKKRTEEFHSINAELRREIEKRKEVEQELIRAREAAEQANDSKTRFLALASHDIIQPLNAANLYASALQELPLTQAQRDTVVKLSQSLQAGEALMGTLLDIARLDQGRLKATPETVDLHTLLQPLLTDYRMRAQEKGVKFHASVHRVFVYSDPTYLYRVVQNLLSNAVKYTEKGSIIVRISKSKSNVKFCIADTGIGLSDIEQQKVFEDFFRCDDHKETGVGLGLGVVRRLCDLLSIHMEMTSEKHVGTRFWFTLPEVCRIAEPPLKKPMAKRLSLTGLRALCVDDKPENLAALTSLLQRWGVQSHCCSQASDALSSLGGFAPHVLLIDYQLGPSSDGISLIRQIRASLNKDVFAVLVTASHEDGLRQRCEEAGIHLLRKPLKPAKLRTLLQAVTY